MPPSDPDDVDAKRRFEQRALVAEGLPHVEPIAIKLARQLGALGESDELAAVGRAALVEIASSYDPDKGPFLPFARTRLKWAMLDSVRRETHGRMFSARACALAAAERVAQHARGEAPDPGLPEESHVKRLRGVLAAQAAAMVASLVTPFADEGTSTGEQRVLARRGGRPREPSPEEIILFRRQREALRAAVHRLEPRAKEIIERHYFGGERFDQIAESLGVSKSWLSRLHAQALQELAEVLKGYA